MYRFDADPRAAARGYYASGDSALTLRPVPLDLDQYDAVLLDLDGTVYHEEYALPGAVELIRRLQAKGKPYACLTNSTTSPQHLSARLARMGLTVDPFHIYTAAAATCDYVAKSFGPNPRVFNLSTEGVNEMLDGRVQWVQRAEEPCDAVICGVVLNVYATEDRQRTALVLLRAGAKLVSICADRVYPSPRGIEFGVGAMAAMFAYAADVTPTFCGKPEKIFFIELCRRLNVHPEKCVLIGDNLESDIAGGKSVGMSTILTLGGIATRDDLKRASHQPDGIIKDLTDLL
jgi:4-nitrophenyl phosphatase